LNIDGTSDKLKQDAFEQSDDLKMSEPRERRCR
jgi:hypothetical protein